MTRTVYVNGDYLPEGEAKVSIFDRGFLMADGVYEVTSVLDGKLIDFDGHIRRLERSLTELEMTCPVSLEDLLAMHRELVRLNGPGLVPGASVTGDDGRALGTAVCVGEREALAVLAAERPPGLAVEAREVRALPLLGGLQRPA